MIEKEETNPNGPRETRGGSLKQFRIAGYVESLKVGNRVTNHLTEEGERKVGERFRTIMPLPPIKPLGANSGANYIDVEDKDKEERIENTLNRFSPDRTSHRTRTESSQVNEQESVKDKWDRWHREHPDWDPDRY